MAGSQLFLVQAFVIIVLPYGLWHLSRLCGVVPCVVFQILVGIALGPSIFGQWLPDLYAALFSKAVIGNLSGIASLALLFFGFISGLHLEPRGFQSQGKGFAIVGATSVLVPTALGILAGLWIVKTLPQEIGTTASAGEFVVAIGISAGVTALPVLSSILREMKLLQDRLGQWALGLAAINDAALWILLAALLEFAVTPDRIGVETAVNLGLFLVYLTVMFWGIKPFLQRLATTRTRFSLTSDGFLLAVAAIAILSSTMTELLGLHYVLGAFIAGSIMPQPWRKAILDKIEAMTTLVLMPFFFMLTGLRTNVDFGSEIFGSIFLVVTTAAILGKVLGTAIPFRLLGNSWRDGAVLGFLMQTKGLMEVIVLTILLDAGIISETIFSALILMALFSTAIVMPLVRAVLRGGLTRQMAVRQE